MRPTEWTDDMNRRIREMASGISSAETASKLLCAGGVDLSDNESVRGIGMGDDDQLTVLVDRRIS